MSKDNPFGKHIGTNPYMNDDYYRRYWQTQTRVDPSIVQEIREIRQEIKEIKEMLLELLKGKVLEIGGVE